MSNDRIQHDAESRLIESLRARTRAGGLAWNDLDKPSAYGFKTYVDGALVSVYVVRPDDDATAIYHLGILDETSSAAFETSASALTAQGRALRELIELAENSAPESRALVERVLAKLSAA